MPSPDPIAPDRLEELLGGALPESEREASIQGLLRELRADAPAVPAPLRARVHALEDEALRRHRGRPRRRTAMALAFALLAIAGAAAGVVLSGGEEPAADRGVPAAPTEVDVGAPAPDVTEEPAGGEAAPKADLFAPQRKRVTTLSKAADAPLAPSRRATDVDLWMEVRLADAEALSDAAGAAMALTRELGGWVAGSDIDTQGREGTAELALRVPVGRVEDAVVRLGELGTVTGQRVATVDLQSGIDRRADRIERLERAIRLLELRLESGTLTAEGELRARLRIERHRNEIADLRRATLADRREAATSELTLALHTREAAAKRDAGESGVAGAARDALDVLGAAGAIALFLAIVLSPVVLLLVLLWLAFRARSRRLETRLLDRADPASPHSA